MRHITSIRQKNKTIVNYKEDSINNLLTDRDKKIINIMNQFREKQNASKK